MCLPNRMLGFEVSPTKRVVELDNIRMIEDKISGRMWPEIQTCIKMNTLRFQ